MISVIVVMIIRYMVDIVYEVNLQTSYFVACKL